MFELIKLVLERVLGQISFEAIKKRRKDEKLATIGSELMLLYMSLNAVIVVGEAILSTLRQMSRSQDREHDYSPQRLQMLVRSQAEQLLKVIASCDRLSTELAVIDETGGAGSWLDF